MPTVTGRKYDEAYQKHLKDRIKFLEDENAKETSWGAAIGARNEEIKGLKRALNVSEVTPKTEENN